MPVITDVKCHVIPIGGENRFGFKRKFEWQCLLVRIETDEGVAGFAQPVCIHGEGMALAWGIVGVMKPLLLGEDPRLPERIWQKIRANMMKGQVPRNAVGAVDIAVWDLAAKFAGQPLYRMLSPARDKIRAYASTITLGTPEEYGPLCLNLKEQGFTAIKLHIWGDPKRDVEAYRVSREALGDDFELMFDIDGAYGYNRQVALWVGRAVQEMGCNWYETPLAQDDLEGYRELRDHLDVLISGPDMLFDLDDFPAWISRRATDMVRPNAEMQFGLTGQRKVAALAEAYHVRCEPHTFGFPLSQAANLAGVLAIESCTFWECPAPVGMMDYLTHDVVRIDKDGNVAPTEKPGIGLEIDFAEVDRRTAVVVA
jgi:L-alanine-DL-glutamate epimerase-like enolase superfamily enzyme